MAHVMKLKDGKVETVFNLADALELVGRYAGCELRHYLECQMSDADELEKEIEHLEKEQEEELERLGDHQRAVLNDIKDETEALDELLDEERLDRKKLRKCTDNIWRMCYGEL